RTKPPDGRLTYYLLAGVALAVLGRRFCRVPAFSDWLVFVAIVLGGVAAYLLITEGRRGPLLSRARSPWRLDVLGPVGLFCVVVALATGNVTDDTTANVIHLSLALSAFAIAAWSYWLTRKNRGSEFQLL